MLFASQAATAVANARTHRDERRARADLEALVETSPVAVAVFDARSGRPVLTNREARRLVEGLRTAGRPSEELLQAATCRFSDGSEIVLGELPLPQVLGSARTLRAEEIVISVPDGRSVTALANTTPIRSDGGEVESVIVTLQDLAPLQELERLRADFLGMVSHELRAPLAAIKGSAVTLLEDFAELDPAERREFYRIIEEQADHMRGLIGDLLDAGRIEAGTLSVAPEPSEVAALVDRARSTFLSAGGRHTVVIDLPPDLPRVMADRRRIVQVLEQPALERRPALAPLGPDPGRGRARRRARRRLGPRRGPGRGARAAAAPVPQVRARRRRRGRAAGHGPRARHLQGAGRGARRPHPGRERRDRPGRPVHLHPPGGRGCPAERVRRPRPAPGATLPEPDEPARVLVVDDDPQTLRYVRDTLTAAGYAAVVTGDHAQLSRTIRSRAAAPGPARPRAARRRRHRADGKRPRAGRPAGGLHLRLRPRRDRSPRPCRRVPPTTSSSPSRRPS